MCGQAEGAARSGAGWQESRGRHPPLTPPHPAKPQPCAHQTQRLVRTDRPRPQELEQRLQEPHGIHSPGPYLGRERHHRHGEEPGGPRLLALSPTSMAPLGPRTPSPEHGPPNRSSRGSTAKGASGRGGAWGSSEDAAVGAPAGQGLNPSSVPTGCVIWGSNLTSLDLCSCL